MKRLMAALAVTVLASVAFAPRTFAGTGNGFPRGPHFDLNIHGVDKGQTFNGFNGNNKNDIFVPLYGKCAIDLVQAATYDFQVLQPDCVSNPTATFELPAPCAISATTGLCTSSTTYYSVYAKAPGVSSTSGVSSTLTTCGIDSTGTQVCSLNSYVAVTGVKNKATNVTSDLLFLTTSVNGKTVYTPIFSQNYQSYFWQYDNYGLKLLQLRFYQVPSCVPGSPGC